jgi:N-acetyl-anhydromuramyl-L-alanine amidase AmpD
MARIIDRTEQGRRNANGQLGAVKGLVFHHTGYAKDPTTGKLTWVPTVDSVVNNVSVHFVMDRDGQVYQILPDGSRGKHVLKQNNSYIGVEYIARDDADITQAQRDATKGFVEEVLPRYGLTPSPDTLLGHTDVPGQKEVNHRRISEGQTARWSALTALGFPAPETKIFGDNGSGKPTSTWAELASGVPQNNRLAYNSTPNNVQQLQTQLKSMGFDPGKVDGVMGSRTKSAIRKFQDANGLTADGIVGPQTINALSAAMGGSSVSVPGSQNYRNVTGVAPAGVSVSPRYNPNVGIGDSGNAAMSVTPRVPFEANFRDPADPILNNISPERAKRMSRGLDMNVSREQSAKDVLIGGLGALLGKPFPMGSAPASNALTSVSRPTYVVDSSGNIVDRTTGAKVGQSEPSVFANTGLNTLRRQIGFTDASRVAPAVPAAASKPAAPVATPYLPGMTLPRPASVPVTAQLTPASTGPKVVYSGDPSIGNMYVYPKVPYTEGDPNRLKPQPVGLPLNTNPITKFAVPYYASNSPSLAARPTVAANTSVAPIPLPRNARPTVVNTAAAKPLPASAPLSYAPIKPTPPAPTKLTGFGGMTGTSFQPAAPIPMPYGARPVAPANTALAATSQLAGVKPVSKNVSSYSGSSSSGGGSSSSAPIEGSSTGKLYNVGQTYTTGGGLKYVAQADGTFKKV